MTRSLILALMGVVFLSTLAPSAASAQDDCLFYYNKVDEETGETIRICSQNARQTTVATAAVGVVNPARGVTSSVSPNHTSSVVSPAVDAYPILRNDRRGGGYYESPRDPRPEWAILDAVLDGVTVTHFERELEGAADRGRSDGQYAAMMAAIEGLRAEIARQKRYFAEAVATGNADLAHRFEARIAGLERQLAAVQAPPVKPKPTGGGKSDGKSEEDKEAERRAARMVFCRENPEECRVRGATVHDYFGARK